MLRPHISPRFRPDNALTNHSANAGKKTPETFGSDHFAVSTRFLFDGTAPQPVPRETPGGSDGGIRISSLLPDPPGPDSGNEWVKLMNDGHTEVDRNGWTLRDAGNNAVGLSGSIASGEVRQVDLAHGQMPLNQNGDKIALLNPAGNEVDSVEYTSGQVSSGVPINFPP